MADLLVTNRAIADKDQLGNRRSEPERPGGPRAEVEEGSGQSLPRLELPV